MDDGSIPFSQLSEKGQAIYRGLLARRIARTELERKLYAQRIGELQRFKKGTRAAARVARECCALRRGIQRAEYEVSMAEPLELTAAEMDEARKDLVEDCGHLLNELVDADRERRYTRP